MPTRVQRDLYRPTYKKPVDPWRPGELRTAAVAAWKASSPTLPVRARLALVWTAVQQAHGSDGWAGLPWDEMPAGTTPTRHTYVCPLACALGFRSWEASFGGWDPRIVDRPRRSYAMTRRVHDVLIDWFIRQG
jgi:hypothetical protein